MKTNKMKMQEFFGDNEIHICCVAKDNKVGCCSIDTTKVNYEDITEFDKIVETLKDSKLTAVSSIIFAVKMLNTIYSKDPDAVKNAKVIHLMINDASYSSYVCSSKYGNVLGKVLHGMLEASDIEKSMCTLVKQVMDKFPNLIIDPVSVGSIVSEESDLKTFIAQSWELVLGDKARKVRRSKFAK